jgi:hypothetical protein
VAGAVLHPARPTSRRQPARRYHSTLAAAGRRRSPGARSGVGVAGSGRPMGGFAVAGLRHLGADGLPRGRSLPWHPRRPLPRVLRRSALQPRRSLAAPPSPLVLRLRWLGLRPLLLPALPAGRLVGGGAAVAASPGSLLTSLLRLALAWLGGLRRCSTWGRGCPSGFSGG